MLLSLVRSTYSKILFGTVVGFIGIAGGVYVGNELVSAQSGTNSQQPLATDQRTENIPYVAFDVGDGFPDAPYYDREGNIHSFSDLLNGKETILIFGSFACDPCIELKKFWGALVKKDIPTNVQVIWCISKFSTSTERLGQEMLEENVVMYSFDYYNEMYGFTMIPTMFRISSTGLVRHIQFGFTGYVQREIYADFDR